MYNKPVQHVSISKASECFKEDTHFGVYRLIWSVGLEWVAGNDRDGWKTAVFL